MRHVALFSSPTCPALNAVISPHSGASSVLAGIVVIVANRTGTVTPEDNKKGFITVLNTEAPARTRPHVAVDSAPAFNPKDFEAWDARGLELYEDKRTLKLRIVKWITDGQRFGEAIYQSQALAKFNEYSEQYIDQIMHVSRHVPESNWIPGASFSHLREVASIPEPAVQKRLLEVAVKNDLTVEDLKAAVRKVKAVKGEPAPIIEKAFNFHFRSMKPRESKKAYEAMMDAAYADKKAEHLVGTKDHVQKAKNISRREAKKKRR